MLVTNWDISILDLRTDELGYDGCQIGIGVCGHGSFDCFESGLNLLHQLGVSKVFVHGVRAGKNVVHILQLVSLLNLLLRVGEARLTACSWSTFSALRLSLSERSPSVEDDIFAATAWPVQFHGNVLDFHHCNIFHIFNMTVVGRLFPLSLPTHLCPILVSHDLDPVLHLPRRLLLEQLNHDVRAACGIVRVGTHHDVVRHACAHYNKTSRKVLDVLERQSETG